MTDPLRFTHGGVSFPLADALTNSLLQDADPVLFHGLAYLSWAIATYAGDRLLAQAAAASAPIASAVAASVPMNPAPFLRQEHFKFPLLALWRTKASFDVQSISFRRDACDCMLAYVLPPMAAGEVEQILPILNAVKGLLDRVIDLGYDVAYTPPGGVEGDPVWRTAGVEKVMLKSAEFGAFADDTGDLYFPALTAELTIRERSGHAPEQFEDFAGADTTVDVPVSDGTVVAAVVQIATQSEPTVVSASPATGTKAGGTPVTIGGTLFKAPATVNFGSALASAVVVVSPTVITCETPAHDAYPTAVVDIVVTNQDGQEATLEDSFTFTSP